MILAIMHLPMDPTDPNQKMRWYNTLQRYTTKFIVQYINMVAIRRQGMIKEAEEASRELEQMIWTSHAKAAVQRPAEPGQDPEPPPPPPPTPWGGAGGPQRRQRDKTHDKDRATLTPIKGGYTISGTG